MSGEWVEEISSAVASLSLRTGERAAPVLIGIDGPGGAGKTTVARRLSVRLEQMGVCTTIVHMDDFYLSSVQRDTSGGRSHVIGGDFDWQRLHDQVVDPLRQGQPARYQRYDWGTDALAEWHVVGTRGAAIVEGVYSLRRGLVACYDLTVWVDCPRDVRLARGIARDGEEAREDWECRWMPAEDAYVAAHAPDRAADFVVACYGSPGSPSGRLIRRSREGR